MIISYCLQDLTLRREIRKRQRMHQATSTRCTKKTMRFLRYLTDGRPTHTRTRHFPDRYMETVNNPSGGLNGNFSTFSDMGSLNKHRFLLLKQDGHMNKDSQSNHSTSTLHRSQTFTSLPLPMSGHILQS